MVRFDRRNPARGPVIQGFAAGGFSVDGTVHRALLLTPQHSIGWTPPPIDALTIDMLATILDIDPIPEFLILGTGATTRFPPARLTAALEAKGVGLESMDSRAAARTWGLLRGEERWIVAALMPLE